MSVDQSLAPELVRATGGARRTHGPACARVRASVLAVRLLPLLDLAVAVAVASVWLSHPVGVVVFAGAAVPLLAMLVGYVALPLGGRDVPRLLARLTLVAIACQWLALLAGEQVVAIDPVASALWPVLACLIGWSAARFVLAARTAERVVIVGSGVAASRIVSVVGRHAARRLDVRGFLDSSGDDGPPGLPRLGPVGDLSGLLASGTVDRVMVASPTEPSEAELIRALRECDAHGVPIDIVPRLFDFTGAETRGYAIGGLPLTTVTGRGGRPCARFFKRSLDVSFCVVVLLVLSPLLAVLALAVWLEDRGPIVFRQERIGRFGQPFGIFKLRTMRVDATQADETHITRMRLGAATITEVVADIKPETDPRVTRIGRLLRKTSLDEIPQLWNVLRGDMSLVGPRPLRDFEVAALSDWELTRHLERPGITGLWQVTGRSAVPWDERMLLDYMYVRHWSLAGDVEILVRTFPAVVSGSGAR